MSDHEQEQDSGPWLDYKKAANHVSLPVSSLRKMVMRKEIPFRKVGRRVLFSVPALDHWVGNNGSMDSNEASAA